MKRYDHLIELRFSGLPSDKVTFVLDACAAMWRRLDGVTVRVGRSVAMRQGLRLDLYGVSDNLDSDDTVARRISAWRVLWVTERRQKEKP